MPRLGADDNGKRDAVAHERWSGQASATITAMVAVLTVLRPSGPRPGGREQSDGRRPSPATAELCGGEQLGRVGK